METGITFTFAAIFLGAAILSSAALYARQPIIIAYIALGIALGPFGLGVVSDMELVSGAGHVGIILLLFLTRAGYEADRPLEQPETIHAGSGLECCDLRRNRLRIKSSIWLRRDGCSADQRCARVLFYDHWHQAATYHCAAPPASGRDDDRSAAISGSARHHCAGDDGERGRRGSDLACASSAAADSASAGLVSWLSVKTLLLTLIRAL